MNQMSARHIKQLAAGFLSAILLTALDQVTKYLAVLHLKNNSAVSLIPDVFELSYLENHGAAFGILQGQKSFFVTMTVIVLVVLIFLYIRIPDTRRYTCMRLILMLLISGAIGNFIDRCLHNYVIDFFYFKLIDFPVFNVADIYVSTAAVLLILLFIFYYKEEDIDMLIQMLQFWKKKEQ